MSERFDAVVVGSGPNGLAAAITVAEAGHSVLVLEAAASPGGGARSAELTLPGFVHDVCSAIHPLAAGSPFLRRLGLEQYGLRMLVPDVQLAHPLDDGSAVALRRSVAATAVSCDRVDARTYERLFESMVEHAGEVVGDVLSAPAHAPRHPLASGRFASHALLPATMLARRFRGQRARALIGGMAAHSFLRLSQPISAASVLMLALCGHAYGWPAAEGGSQSIITAMIGHLERLGGRIETGTTVRGMEDLPGAGMVFFDVTPRQLDRIAGPALPERYLRRLRRYRYGPGVFKVDYALSEPLPWTADDCRAAGTVHLGGTFEEIADDASAVAAGRTPDRPFVLVGQQSIVDATRAPAGMHTLWVYCHVPNGSTVDMTERIEGQIERFAPGFRDLVLARHTTTPADLERYNANYVGGDISGGLQDLRQLFTRPVLRTSPYATPNPRIFLCSSSTPPGGGVHGMCGYSAAHVALRRRARGG
jgi:phytoene dehydrogenase-like protein